MRIGGTSAWSGKLGSDGYRAPSYTYNSCMSVEAHVITPYCYLMLNRLTYPWCTENSEPIVHRDDDDVPRGGYDTSVISISGSKFVSFAMNEENDCQRWRFVLIYGIQEQECEMTAREHGYTRTKTRVMHFTFVVLETVVEMHTHAWIHAHKHTHACTPAHTYIYLTCTVYANLSCNVKRKQTIQKIILRNYCNNAIL